MSIAIKGNPIPAIAYQIQVASNPRFLRTHHCATLTPVAMATPTWNCIADNPKLSKMADRATTKTNPRNHPRMVVLIQSACDSRRGVGMEVGVGGKIRSGARTGCWPNPSFSLGLSHYFWRFHSNAWPKRRA